MTKLEDMKLLLEERKDLKSFLLKNLEKLDSLIIGTERRIENEEILSRVYHDCPYCKNGVEDCPSQDWNQLDKETL